ncbi:hypothetical protein [Streptomyces sp. SAS_270]|uniref:hypothetical protein n=1 Tax=Streptomyces sp. SAS_270 TaxID=3412748 RepID=UPI00403C0F17
MARTAVPGIGGAAPPADRRGHDRSTPGRTPSGDRVPEDGMFFTDAKQGLAQLKVAAGEFVDGSTDRTHRDGALFIVD